MEIKAWHDVKSLFNKDLQEDNISFQIIFQWQIKDVLIGE